MQREANNIIKNEYYKPSREESLDLKHFQNNFADVFTQDSESLEYLNQIKIKYNYCFNLMYNKKLQDSLIKYFNNEIFSTFENNILSINEYFNKNEDDIFLSRILIKESVKNYYKNIYQNRSRKKECIIKDISKYYFKDNLKPKFISRKLKYDISKIRKIISKEKYLKKKKSNNINNQNPNKKNHSKYLKSKLKEIQSFYKNNKEICFLSIPQQLGLVQKSFSDLEFIKYETYRKFLHQEMKFKYKKIKYVSPHCNTLKTKNMRILYFKLIVIYFFNNFDLYFTDSTAVTFESIKQYGWGKSNQKLKHSHKNINKRFHYMSTINKKGFIFIKKYPKCPKGNKIVRYYKKLIRKIKKNGSCTNSIIIMDNAKYLHSKKMKKVCKDKQIIFLYTASNSPYLNPIEFIFEYIKRNIRTMRVYDR